MSCEDFDWKLTAPRSANIDAEYFILSRVKDSKVIGVANEDALEKACAQQSVEV